VASIKVHQGRRHDRLVELGAIFRGKGLSPEEVEALLWHHAQSNFDPPFALDNPKDALEIEAVVRWYGGKKSGSDEPVPLEVLDTAELRNRAKAAPVPHLLAPVLPVAGSMMIYGAAGIGKSHVGLCISGALATGGSFLDWVTAAPVETLYIDGEMPLDELDARIASYFGDDPLPRLKWIAARAQQDDLPNLADSAAQELYLAAIIQTGAKVVVFDNLSCLRSTSAELPENSIEAWQPVGAFIRRLNRLGVAVILVHHASKAGQQRGSTAHVAPMDTVIALLGLGEGQADPLAENDIEIVFEKHRRFAGEAAQSFRAKAIGDADGRVVWQRVGSDPLVDDVVRLRRLGKSIREIAELLKRSKAGVEKALGRAKAKGLLPLGGAHE
jgi:putative DNA primase/helicase